MSESRSPERLHRIVHTAPLLVFVLALLSPMAGTWLGWGGNVAALDFRTPAPFPGVPASLADLDAYPLDMDAYLEDHFGFRSELLALNSRLFVSMGMSPSPKFLVGRDGWFYLRNIDRVLDQYRGIDRFSDPELESWVATMERRQRWLAQRGIRLLVTIAPMKQTIYPEHLPGWVTIVDPERRYRQLRARLARGSSLELVDLHGPLREARQSQRVYHKTDGHWNELGAHAAYAAIVARIQETHPGVPLRGLDAFEVDWVRQPVGTITRRLNIAEQWPEDLPRLRPRSGTAVLRTDFPDGNPMGILDALHSTQVIESDLPDQPTILFLRDSFATDLAHFTQESFRRTILAHHGYGGFRRNLILRYEPDIVVYEMIERGLAWKLH